MSEFDKTLKEEAALKEAEAALKEAGYESIKMDATACPGCGIRNDAATALSGDGPPEVGNISVCFNCGVLLVFNDKLMPVRPDDEVQLYLDMPADIRAFIVKIQDDIRKRGRLWPKNPTDPQSPPPSPDHSTDQ